jgi:hypothetical protein
VPSEIRKLPCFEVEIPDHCMLKWGELYEQYRKDMRNALSGGRSNSNEEANEVIKMYKQVSILQFFFSRSSQFFEVLIGVSFSEI